MKPRGFLKKGEAELAFVMKANKKIEKISKRFKKRY